jgi:hypothetical protein
MIHKIALIISLSSLFVLSSYAQDDDNYYRQDDSPQSFSFKDRIQLGGGAGMQFGNRTLIEASPKLSFAVSDKFYIGAGLSYTYYRLDLDRIQGYGGVYQTSIFGGSAFANYLILENVLAYVEYEGLNFEQYDFLLQDYDRVWVGSFFVGGGYRQYLGNGRSYIQILLLYNLNFQPNSPYSSPFVPRVQVYF